RPGAGFSLIELMVVVAIVAILAVVAYPALGSVINSNRLSSHANEMVASLQLARSEAIRRNATVSVCGSTDGSTCVTSAGAWASWLTVLDSDDTVLFVHVAKPSVEISSNAAKIVYGPDGLARVAVNT